MLMPEAITRAEFDAALLRYPTLLKAVSASKTVKGDEESLEDLDWFRFMSAPNRYMKREGDVNDVPLEKDDLVRLVKWKLKHGKFRPNLLKLASFNPPHTVAATSLAAFAMEDTVSSLRTLSLLTGIGPATASLLLSVHDPEHVLFFSDEAYRWLVCHGREQPIRYNLKEYEQLEVNAKVLMERLEVEARDVERVAFVIMRGGTEVSKKETAADVENARTTPSQRRKSGEKETSDDVSDVSQGTIPTATKQKSKLSAEEKGKGKAVEAGTAQDAATEEHVVANTRKLRSSLRAAAAAARAAEATPDSKPRVEIPDAKTLARKASQRIMESAQQQPLERQRTAEDKLGTVVEDVKSASARLARAVPPPRLRSRRGDSAGDSSGGDRAETGRVLRRRDGSLAADKDGESGEPAPPLQQPRQMSVKRASSETKMREAEPQTAAGKRPRREGKGARLGPAGADADAATVTSVDCVGCFKLLGRPS